MDNIFYIGEVGKTISISCGFDLTSVSSKSVTVYRSNLSHFTQTATEVTVDDALTGQLHILTRSGDLSVSGAYSAQAKLTWTDGSIRFSPIISFMVESVYDETYTAPTTGSYSIGDLLYANSTTSLTRLPIGGLSNSLKVSSSGIPSWSVELYNVKDFGAVGNDSTDDTAAIQTAIDAAASAGGGIVFFPQGVYRVSTNANILYVNSGGCLEIKTGVSLRGAGINASIIRADATQQNIILGGAANHISIHDLSIWGEFTTSQENTDCIKLLDCSNIDLYNVYCYGMRIGFQIYGIVDGATAATDISLVGCRTSNQAVETANSYDPRGFSVIGANRVNLVNCNAISAGVNGNGRGFVIDQNGSHRSDVNLVNCKSISCDQGLVAANSEINVLNFQAVDSFTRDTTISGCTFPGYNLMEENVVIKVTADSPYTLDPSECWGNTVLTNVLSSGSVQFNLPTSVAGMKVSFCVMTAQNVVINPVNGDIIIGLTNALGDSITNNAQGAFITLRCIYPGSWIPMPNTIGTWSDTN